MPDSARNSGLTLRESDTGYARWVATGAGTRSVANRDVRGEDMCLVRSVRSRAAGQALPVEPHPRNLVRPFFIQRSLGGKALTCSFAT